MSLCVSLRALALGLCAAVVLVGCSRKDEGGGYAPNSTERTTKRDRGPEKRAPERRLKVSGTVFLDGKPFESCKLYFWYVSEPGAVRVELSRGDGAYGTELEPGSYRVAVLALRPVKGPDGKTDEAELVNILPEQYSKPETSGISVTVGDSDRTFDLQLRSR